MSINETLLMVVSFGLVIQGFYLQWRVITLQRDVDRLIGLMSHLTKGR